MRILYLDCFSGISGDMMVGALADLGVTPSTFEWELSNLDIGDFHLHFERQTRRGIAGVKFGVHAGATHIDDEEHDPMHAHSHDGFDGEVVHEKDAQNHSDYRCAHGQEHSHHGHHHADEHDHSEEGQEHDAAHRHDKAQPHEKAHHPHHEQAHDDLHRSYADIRSLLDASGLSSSVKQHANSIFRRMAEAEAKIHGVQPEEVEFHEIGALDSIVDVVMTCIGIEALQVEQLHFSELVDGTGTVRCAHGDYPLPAPATLEILKGLPIRQIPIPGELITPTGAAIIAEFQHSVDSMPKIRPRKIGYGLGSRDFPGQPNVLRAVLADLESFDGEGAAETIWEVQANIDDSSPEILGATLDQLLKAGAVDAYFTPVQMKKNRPGVLLTTLCSQEFLEAVQGVIFRETTTFGLRYHQSQRVVLDREEVEVQTEAGPIKVKIGRFQESLLQVSPEFESCRISAEKSGLPLRKVYELAVNAFWSHEKAI
jgi:pyridinium-3,5-bisthiocarboxylic acid mononucleotide nickel chelatase